MMRRSLVIMTITIMVWGMWDRWWHLAGFMVCCICWMLIEASERSKSPEQVVKEARELDRDLTRHMAAVDQAHAGLRDVLSPIVMCNGCKRLFDNVLECEEHLCGM